MKTITANITTAMRRILIILLAVTLVIIMIPNPFATTKNKSKAKTKKITLTVHKVQVGDKKIKGKITQNGKKIKNANKYRVVARRVVVHEESDGTLGLTHPAGPKAGKYYLGKKKYNAKVKKNGTFTIKGLPKLKERLTAVRRSGEKTDFPVYIKISLYKGKKFKRTKVVCVQYKDIAITQKVYNNILSKAKNANGKTPIRHYTDGKTPKYLIGINGYYSIGEPDHYIKDVIPFAADSDYVEMKAINGATIYLNVLWRGEVTDTYQEFKKALEDGVDTEWGMGSDGLALLERWYQAAKPWDWKGYKTIPDPSPQSYQYKILPGQSVRIYGKDFPELSPARECLLYKATVYVKGKVMAANCSCFDHSPQGYKLEWR